MMATRFICRNTILALSVHLLLIISAEANRQKNIKIQIEGLLGAFGDFDSDKYTDLFVIHSNLSSFEIRKASADNPYNFQSQPELACSTAPDQTIVGLIPADYHGEAMLDVVVLTKSKSNTESDSFRLFLIEGNRTALNCSNLTFDQHFAVSRIQPLLLDFNGDMIGDLFIQHRNNTCAVYMFAGGDFTPIHFPCRNSIRNPNSNAFIDLNNDFIPDVFIEEDREFVYFTLTGQFETNLTAHSHRAPFPETWVVRGLSTFFDLNSDGRIEHVLPVCLDSACAQSQIVAYQLAEHRFVSVAADSSEWILNDQQLCFTPSHSDPVLTFPFKLRHADVDGDGFIDLLGLMHECRRPLHSDRWIVFRNEEAANGTFGRHFRPKWTLDVHPEPIESDSSTKSVTTHALFGTFLDLGEDGRPDFLLQSKVNGTFVLNTLPNVHMVDACFLKVMVISGRCYEDCGKAIGKTLQNPFINYNVLGYGTNQAGQSIYFELVDSEGRQRQSCAGQMTQSADFALQMPYNVFGIGQLPNFIDTLIASVPIDNTKVRLSPSSSADRQHVARRQTWTQIVPDSQVVVIPHPPDQPGLWRTKLFITPSEYVLSTLITLLCICFLLSIIIYLLWRREMLEDLAEHQEYKRHWPESK